ncbi:lantibiotic dehydratase [Streptomyces sp. NPDC001889]
MAHRSPITYQWQPGALLRASTSPSQISVPDIDLHGTDLVTQGRQWLSGVWHPPVPDALSAASPILCERVNDILTGTVTDARRVRRAVRSVAAYLLRWNHRPTPFGVFAGVAPVRPAVTARVEWEEGYRTVLRPDSDWMTGMVTQLEKSPALLARLTVVANNTGRARGGRHVVDGMPADAHTAGYAPVELSVRLTRPVAAVLAAADTPIPFEDLIHRLTREFPTAHPEQFTGLITGLLGRHVLISSLWPAMTSVDPLAHICTQLEKANAASIAEVADLAARLADIRDRIDHAASSAPWAPGSALVRDMSRLSPVARVPLLVDAALDCTVDIPKTVLNEAAEAAQVMHQLSPHPYGYPQWRDYHQRFLDRYGTGVAVPVRALIGDSGLGLPAGFLGSDRDRAPYELTDRDERILRLLQEVTRTGGDELVLTRATIADLTAFHTEPPLPSPRAEIAVEIHAPTVEAIQRGEYRLLVNGAPRPGSSMFGRFAHLLPPPARAALTDSYATTIPGAIPAQLMFSPRRRRNENVARTPQILPHTIPLGQHHEPGPGVIPLDDLAVVADARRFSLIRASTGQRVEPRVLHALEASVHTPPLARFLAEISTARSAAYKSFSFGVANTLQYLPRVRYKRTVLAPARWLLPAEQLPPRSAPMPDWSAALDQWRKKHRVPGRVAMVENDQQLSLGLDQRIHRALLRACVDRTHLVELRETSTPEQQAWIGRPHQLLIPLANPAPASAVPFPSRPAVTAPHLPGRSTVLLARLFAHPARHDEILTSHLPDLLNTFDTPRAWWFQRRRDTNGPGSAPHLALYLELQAPANYGPAAQQLHAWAESLHHQDLTAGLELATYHPHAGRYGQGPVLDAAHRVFAADSAASIAQIRAANDDPARGQALTAASILDLAVHFTGDRRQAANWLTSALPQEHGPVPRKRTALALALADPERTALLALPEGPHVAELWRQRAASLTTYRKELAASLDPEDVMRSLLDEHVIRAMPLDPEHERAVRRLARTCAMRHRERQP